MQTWWNIWESHTLRLLWASCDSKSLSPIEGSQTISRAIIATDRDRWTSGTTNTPFYDGSNFASTENLIVVTATYRMNIFGFPSTSNLGLLDQRLAVEWVHRNIAVFGGDPNRIVMSGQSCGAAAADYWAYAYAANPLVAGLISHSGTAESFPANSPELSEAHWLNVTAQLGCGDGDRLSCMKRQSVAALLGAAAKIPPPPASSAARKQPVFQPTVDNVTVFGDYGSLAEKGEFARVPYLVGHNANESNFYKISAWAQGSLLPPAEWEAFNRDTFICPTNAAAAARVHAHVPVWRFMYRSDWANTRLYPGSGAYHGVDLNMVFGNSGAVTGIPESKAEGQLRRIVQRAWAAFVVDPVGGLDGLGWPQFGQEGPSVIAIGEGNEPRVTVEYPEDC
ncbi:hypothetical protein FE257_004997 [Aspergillus nanangensis]|uniref:Carboxylesterase type B domain-containing protein n=1 Tax=Aspergillus nanangensis TaxID=2582783 RepID=A0AAD4CSS7_ASPNN|nr:hypothetical protein FE257_004997 [Aspergillus nanangensis]